MRQIFYSGSLTSEHLLDSANSELFSGPLMYLARSRRSLLSIRSPKMKELSELMQQMEASAPVDSQAHPYAAQKYEELLLSVNPQVFQSSAPPAAQFELKIFQLKNADAGPSRTFDQKFICRPDWIGRG